MTAPVSSRTAPASPLPRHERNAVPSENSHGIPMTAKLEQLSKAKVLFPPVSQNPKYAQYSPARYTRNEKRVLAMETQHGHEEYTKGEAYHHPQAKNQAKQENGGDEGDEEEDDVSEVDNDEIILVYSEHMRNFQQRRTSSIEEEIDMTVRGYSKERVPRNQMENDSDIDMMIKHDAMELNPRSRERAHPERKHPKGTPAATKYNDMDEGASEGAIADDIPDAKDVTRGVEEEMTPEEAEITGQALEKRPHCLCNECLIPVGKEQDVYHTQVSLASWSS